MFLVIGHSDIAVQLAKWCSERRPTRLIGLASMLQIEDEIGDCEILPLPQPMAVSALPDGGQKPTAVIVVDVDVLEDEEALSTLRERWPDTPILCEKQLVAILIPLIKSMQRTSSLLPTKKRFVLGSVTQVRRCWNRTYDTFQNNPT